MKTRKSQVEHLTGFSHRWFGHKTTAGIAVRRWPMGFGAIWNRHLLERVSGMHLLSAVRMFSCLTQRLGFRLGQTLRGRWLARIATVQREARFQFLNLPLQACDLIRQIAHQRPQLPDQFVFLGNAESDKVGKFVHASACA